MTLRELAKGYDGDVLIKAYENEKSKIFLRRSCRVRSRMQ